MQERRDDNPFFRSWAAPLGAPPLDELRAEHFQEAFTRAMEEREAAAARVAADPPPPTFENTVAPLERASLGLARVEDLFFALVSAHGDETLEALELEVAPHLARHHNRVLLQRPLYERVRAVASSSNATGPEEARVSERLLVSFQRAGAELDDATLRRCAAIRERLAELATRFGQNVLADERDFVLWLEGEEDLAGLPPSLRASLAAAAMARGREGGHALTLSRSVLEPFLAFSARRELRAAAHRAFVGRGARGGVTDNAALMGEMVALRAEAARLMGYESHAHFVLADRMAKEPARARALMEEVWARAKARVTEQQRELEELLAADGEPLPLAPWDWRYYAEKVRQARYDVDEGLVKPYLALDNVLEAAFFVAGRLFGVTFHERDDVPVYHPDVRVFEVRRNDGEVQALFYGDYFARPEKRSGAWMTALRCQHRVESEGRALVVNVCNFARPAAGEPALLGLDDGRTLFHELGHGLHGMLSDVTWPRLSGTNVPTDFVELPSQLFEHWLLEPSVLSRFARHAETDEPMPAALVERLGRARRFQAGVQTVELVGSAFVDLELHSLTEADAANVDVLAFERETLARLGMPAAVGARHRVSHFQHIFSGGYDAGYYSYLWSAMLDNDAFGAFREAGDVFSPAVAARALEYVYAAGHRRDVDEAYRLFRGRAPEVGALLEERGLR